MKNNGKYHVPDPIDVARGERLRKLRQLNGWTQSQLAEKAGEIAGKLSDSKREKCAFKHIGYMENGRRKISLQYIDIFSELFHVRREYLLCEDDFKTNEEKNSYYRNLAFSKEFSDDKAFRNALKAYGLDITFDTKTFRYDLEECEGDLYLDLSQSEYEEFKEELYDFVCYKINRLKKRRQIE